MLYNSIKRKQNTEMNESGQPIENPMSRPSARINSAPAPIQRGSYGLPPRRPAAPITQSPAVQPQATPTYTQTAPSPRPAAPVGTPQFMDFAPRPSAPSAPQPTVATPLFTANPQPVQPLETPAQRPLFTPSQNKAASTPKSEKHHRHMRVQRAIKVVLTVFAVVLLIGGIGRFISAGSTANDTIAVGAVSANDGRSMTIQFTATDGKLHKYSTPSNRDLIPGSAVEIAYRSGAPEATARQVSTVKSARNLGVITTMAGIACLALIGILFSVEKLKDRSRHRASPLTTTATV